VHATALGSVLLAALSPSERERYLEARKLRKFTLKTIVERNALRREIEDVRRKGVAFDGGKFARVGTPQARNDGRIVRRRNETRSRLFLSMPGPPMRDAGSDRLQISSRGFAVLALLQLVLNLLTFVQGGKAGFFHRRNMHKHVFRAVICLNETEALACVEPLHCSSSHENLLIRM
jgi:hypothetical protein